MTLDEMNLRTDQVMSLYLIHLQQMYSTEEMLFTVTPALAIAISTPGVKHLLLNEAGQAPDRMTLLRKIFDELGATPSGPDCQAIKVLVDESRQLIVDRPQGFERDLLLLALALEMKHINIAKYLMAATYARVLELPQQMEALTRVQRAESNIDHQLRFILQGLQGDKSRS